MSTDNPTTLVVGGNGTTGRRVVARLEALGIAPRVGSRRGVPPFSWEAPDTWSAVLRGVDRAYLVHPVMMTPDAAREIAAFSEAAVAAGTRRLVLLSGHGADEMVAPAENAVKDSGVPEWTLVRPSWFDQNFEASADAMLGFRDSILKGELVGNFGTAKLGFVDADDIADVVVAALTEDGHAAQSYDLTGPRGLTFGEAVDEIARATGRPIVYTDLAPAQYRDHLIAQGVPAEQADWMATEMIAVDEELGDGVPRALGRPAKDFADYARDAAATGVWTP